MKASRHVVDRALEASVVGSFSSLGFGIRRRLEHFEDLEPRPGRVILLSGVTSGLGRYSALALAGLGCQVIGIGRNQDRLDDVVAESESLAGSITGYRCDLSDFDAVAALASRIRDNGVIPEVIIHNAGALSDTFTTNAQGVEMTLATHLLGPALLNQLLNVSSQTTVIAMTSGGMYSQAFDLEQLEMTAESYQGTVAYARAKRAQIVLMVHQAWTHECHALAVHPGWTNTPGLSEALPTFSTLLKPVLRGVEAGADTLLWAATQPLGQPPAGQLYFDRRPRSLFKLPKTKVDESTLQAQGDALHAWINERLAPWLA